MIKRFAAVLIVLAVMSGIALAEMTVIVSAMDGGQPMNSAFVNLYSDGKRAYDSDVFTCGNGVAMFSGIQNQKIMIYVSDPSFVPGMQNRFVFYEIKPIAGTDSVFIVDVDLDTEAVKSRCFVKNDLSGMIGIQMNLSGAN